MELPEKIEAALTAYLRSQVQAALDAETLPAYFDPDTQIQPGESAEDITGQLLRCICPDADSETPQFTGNFNFTPTVELVTPAAVQTVSEATSEDPAISASALDKHRAIAAILEWSIMVDNLPAQLNAAALALGEGYELTVFGILDRRPQRSQAAGLYTSGHTFRLYACGRTL